MMNTDVLSFCVCLGGRGATFTLTLIPCPVHISGLFLYFLLYYIYLTSIVSMLKFYILPYLIFAQCYNNIAISIFKDKDTWKSIGGEDVWENRDKTFNKLALTSSFPSDFSGLSKWAKELSICLLWHWPTVSSSFLNINNDITDGTTDREGLVLILLNEKLAGIHVGFDLTFLKTQQMRSQKSFSFKSN